jgi:hypothetical protein
MARTTLAAVAGAAQASVLASWFAPARIEVLSF